MISLWSEENTPPRVWLDEGRSFDTLPLDWTSRHLDFLNYQTSAKAIMNKEPTAKPKLKPRRSARVAIVAGDLQIFQLIYQYRMLRLEHLSLLTRRSDKSLSRRLLKLARAQYLITRKLPQQKHIYGLGRTAAHVLVEKGVDDPELLLKRSRIHELKELGIKHEMMIVDLHVILELASRESNLGLISWKEGSELHDSVTVEDHARMNNLPIWPDAFFTLEDKSQPAGANQGHFFLEADRSSANHPRFSPKIRAYWHYLKQGLHTRKFGIKKFRVLTLTLTEKRAKNLCATASTHLPVKARKYFFFTPLKRFGIENPSPIFEAVHLSARNGDLRYLFVPPLRGS